MRGGDRGLIKKRIWPRLPPPTRQRQSKRRTEEQCRARLRHSHERNVVDTHRTEEFIPDGCGPNVGGHDTNRPDITEGLLVGVRALLPHFVANLVQIGF